MKRVVLTLFFFVSMCYGDTITGTVMTGDRKPVADAVVIVSKSSDPQTVIKKLISDKNGKFRFANLETGYYRIVAKKDAFCDGILGRIEVNQPKFGIVNYEIILSRPGSISGFVYDVEGKAISGAEIECDGKRFRTDLKGFYRIDGLKPGTFYINAVAPGFVKGYNGPIAVEENKETAGTNFILFYGGSIKGSVLDFQTNKPLGKVHVSCSGPIYVSGQTDSNGTFFLDGLKPGSYSIYFYRQGYKEFSMSFSVSARQVLDGGTIRLNLRDKYFYTDSREWIFTPGEKVKLYFNAFRIPSVMIDVYEIDLFNEINRAKYTDRSINSILNSVDISEKKPIFSKKFDISYPSPLSELYGRRIVIGNFPEGVYICTMKPEGSGQTKQWFIVSDVGFISKSCDEKKVYTVFSISKGKALADATVYTFDERWNPAKEMKTDSSGQFSLNQQSRIVVKDGKSCAFSDAISTDNIYTHKRSIYAFTERPVYRPGQTVYFKAILRVDNGSFYRIADFSECGVRIFAPDDSVVYETTIKPEKTGSIYGQWELPEEPPLGIYRIEFHTNGKEGMKGTCNFKVFEYRKPDFAIELNPDKSVYLPGEKIKVSVAAKYYFGAPVKNSEVMWAVYSKSVYECQQEYEQQEEYGGWWRGSLVCSGNSKTDENGFALFEIPAKPSYERKEIYTIEARMIDLSRREITGSVQVVVLPGCFEIILSTEKYIYSLEQEIAVNVLTKYYFGSPLSGKKQFNVVASQETYDRKKRRWSFKPILAKKFFLEGEKTTIKIKPGKAGYIQIAVQGIDEYNNIITGTGYVWITEKDSCPCGYGKKEIEIVSDKKEYSVNETAKILINTSHKDIDFLFTIEGQKLFESRMINMSGNSALLEIPIKSDYIPNIFVSVCGVKDKNFISATRILRISCKEKFLNVEIKPAKKEFQPGETARYTIKTTDHKGNPVSAEFSLGVVDESIYAVSGELVPKIEDFFYGNKENRVSTFYSFYRWFYGGAGKDFSSADIRKNFKDTAFWLPSGFTNENGIASVNLKFPDNLTTWRTTVRAFDTETKVGTGVDRVITTKPLIARLITPRFLVEDDRLLITGVIHNYTGEKQKIFAQLNAAGVEILDAREKTVELENGKSTRIDWKVKVNSAKIATFTFFARGDPYKDGMELTLPVFLYGADERYVFAGKCEDTTTDTFYMPAGVILPSIEARSYIYPSIVSGLFTSLDELAKYPYGCVEQTLNAFLPAIQVSHTLMKIKKEDLYFLANDKRNFEKMIENLPKKVNDGLIKLYNYQNEDGGWGWWQNDASNPYITSYVVFGFVHARKCGYIVNEEKLKKAKEFLRNKISSPDSDFNQKTFMLYALNYAGENDARKVDNIYENRDKLNSYTLAQLCLILHQMKDKRAQELLDYLCKKLVKPGESICYWQAQDGNYSWINSNIEATAWGLLAMLSIDPKRDEIPGILRYLVMNKKGGMWFSTKDTAMCIFALTDFIKAVDELSPDYIVSVYVNDAVAAKEKIDRTNIEKFSTKLEIPGERFEPGKENFIKIEKNGKGNLYYSHDVNYSVRDISISAFDKGFKISRRYTELEAKEKFDEKGNKVYVYDEIKRAVKSGETIRVEITISGGEKYEYVMIEDPIPAGFEVVEQSREEIWWYCTREIKDEKVVFFTSLWGEKEKTIVYYLRAEIPGFYHVLPAKAQLMYLPEIWGRSQGKTLTVE